MQTDLTKVNFYTKSLLKNFSREIINAGTSEKNEKIIKLGKVYNKPSFYPRKFEEWPDTFEIKLIDDQSLYIRRTDISNGGWGENLIIDVEYHLSDSEISSFEQPKSLKIPRVIYQTFKSRYLSKGMLDAVNSWKDINPCYEHYFYDDDECVEFIKKFYGKEVLECYLDLIPGAFKADLWRCCVLLEKGGVYVDSDMVCLRPLDDYLGSDDEFIVARDDPMSKSYLYNAFIACAPKHKFIQKQLDSIVDNVKNRRDVFYLDIAGPGLLGKSVNFCLGRDLNSEFTSGPQTASGFYFNILLHDWKSRSILLDDSPVTLTEYKGKNNEMDSLNIPTYYSLFQKGIVYQRIPRTLYYTTEDYLDINGYMVESFKNKNKYWSLVHYTAEKRSEFFRTHRKEFIDLLGVDAASVYESLETGVEKADFWRYCVIYLKGGLYADADTYCAKPLDGWLLSHDLVVGIEGNLPFEFSKWFGMDAVGKVVGEDRLISVCNWSFAAEPKHEFFKNLILDICKNPVSGGVLVNTGPGRFTKHVFEYFKDINFLDLDKGDLHKGNSVVFSINRFGSNQTHSGSYKVDELSGYDNREDVYIVHLFEGSWRSTPHKRINKYTCDLGISHNLSIKKTDTGYFGVSRLDKDTSRTIFMKRIGDCRSLVEVHFDNEFNILSQNEKPITNFSSVAKFEDFRIFQYKNKDYFSVSYIDEDFNTKVAVLDSSYSYLGDVSIDGALNKSPFTSENKVWEKNWLFFEKDDDLYFIYSTIPNYIVYKCNNFNDLKFGKQINIEWPLDSVPSKEFYSTRNVSVGGSTNPILLKDKDLYLYFVHTKIYNERRYNHYAVLLDKSLNPIKFCKKPIISKYVDYGLFFVMSVLEQDDYLVFSGGIEDNTNFVWQLSKSRIFKTIGI